MAELALNDVQRDALGGELDRMRVAQLVGMRQGRPWLDRFSLVAIAVALYALPPSGSRPSGRPPGLRRGLMKQ